MKVKAKVFLQKKLSGTGGMISFFAGSQILGNAIRIITGFLTARLVSPATLGLFNGIGITQGYLPIAQMGIMNGLNRDYPYYLGKGDQDRALALVQVSQFWHLLLGTISFFVLSGISVYFFINKEFIIGIGWFSYAITSFFLFFSNNHLRVLFRTNRDFNYLSLSNIYRSIAGLVLLIPIYFFGFIGLALKNVGASLVEFYYLWKWKPVTVKSVWNKKLFIDLFKTGFPIHLVGQVASLWVVIQNTLVLKFLGVEGFGLFSIAIMVNGSMSIIPQSLSQVIYPKMSFEYGKGASIAELVKMVIKPILLINLVMIPSIIAAWFALPYIVNIFLPKYIGGIEAAQWILILNGVMCWSAFNNIFSVINKQHHYLISLLFGMGIYLIALFMLKHFNGLSITIFPKAMAIGFFFMLMMNLFYIVSYINKEKRTISIN